MKKLLMGNEAIALGAIRAGVSVVTGYPGTPSTEILETVAKEAAVPDSRAIYVEWSVNEKAALEVAAGAAVSGARSLVTMKQVGLNVASDPLMSLNYLGVLGGLVVAVADDPGPLSSQTEQDSRHFARYAKLAAFDPSSVEEAYLMISDAFDVSEKYGRPVIFRPTTRICHSYASVELDSLPQKSVKTPSGFDKSSGRWVIFPNLAFRNHGQIEKDLVKMGKEFFSCRGNSLTLTHNAPARNASYHQKYEHTLPDGNGVLGIAAGGVSFAYAMEALDPMPSGLKILKIGTFPFPESLAMRFLEGLDDVLVLEELDPVIEDELLRLLGSHHMSVEIRGKRSEDMPRAGEYTPALVAEKIEAFLKRRIWSQVSEMEKTIESAENPVFGSLSSINMEAGAGVEAQPRLPVRPPVLCAGCPHRGSFYAVKRAAQKSGGGKAVFSGDIGCYTLGNAQPLEMVDTCLCMGAGITMAQGIGRVEEGHHFAFIGDSTFFHTGIPALVNAVYNRSDIIVVVLDNGTTAMTGNQPHPGIGLDVFGRKTVKIDIAGLAAAIGIKEIVRLNPFEPEKAESAIGRLMEKKGVRLAIFEEPCIALKKQKAACYIDAEKCTGCLKCVRELGCPAVSIAHNAESLKPRAVIDLALCTGCGLCKGLCSFGAITGQAKKGGTP